MRFGVTFFFTDETVRPAELGKAAEDLGFDSFWQPEHTHIPASRVTPPPMGPELPRQYYRTLDPFVALSQIAAVTQTIRIGTGICLVAQRDPIVTAKEVATLDYLSGGRFDFGIGYGWNQDELEDHGVAFADRREVTRERVLAMRALWSEGVNGFEGTHVTVSPSYADPKPVQERLPVYLGSGTGPKGFAALVDYADGWIPIGGSGLREAIPALHRELEAAGRDPADFPICPFGSIADPAKLNYFEELGCDQVVFNLRGTDRTTTMSDLEAAASAVSQYRGQA